MILVTGGSGYIGSHICKLLEEKGIKHINFDLVDELDIRSWIDLDMMFTICKIDAVIHCAALKSVPESLENPIAYYETNVLGTINLLKVMKEHSCNKIIFASSAAVYDLKSPYGKSKDMCETIIKDSGVNYNILRFFNVYGDGGNELINKIINKEPITIYGGDYNTKDGTCVRDFIHVKDIARICVDCLNYDFSGTTDLGTGVGYTIKELCDIAECPYTIGERRPGDIESSVATTCLKMEYDIKEVIVNEVNNIS